MRGVTNFSSKFCQCHARRKNNRKLNMPSTFEPLDLLYTSHHSLSCMSLLLQPFSLKGELLLALGGVFFCWVFFVLPFFKAYLVYILQRSIFIFLCNTFYFPSVSSVDFLMLLFPSHLFFYSPSYPLFLALFWFELQRNDRFYSVSL